MYNTIQQPTKIFDYNTSRDLFFGNVSDKQTLAETCRKECTMQQNYVMFYLLNVTVIPRRCKLILNLNCGSSSFQRLRYNLFTLLDSQLQGKGKKKDTCELVKIAFDLVRLGLYRDCTGIMFLPKVHKLKCSNIKSSTSAICDCDPYRNHKKFSRIILQNTFLSCY